MQDFEKEFQDFISVGNQSSLVTDIYKIIETVNPVQMLVLDSMQFYGQKYNIDTWLIFREKYLELKQKNKELHFLKSSFISKLARYSVLDDLQRGIKHSQSSINSDR